MTAAHAPMTNPSPLSTTRTPAQGPQQQAMLGRFELRSILGEGAQSVVWLAFDPRLEREVAIKLMKVATGADRAALARWLQEARSVSRLTHANIIPVFEADLHEQQPYLVFEYVAGQTLSTVLAQRGALPAAEAAALMLDVLDALVAAHAAGIVHRDLKPANILVDRGGRARVMDFGIAAPAADPRSPGGPAPTGGSPAYMSPEAAEGKPAAPSMDIFSAGLLFAEMLSGTPLITQTDPYRAIYRLLHEQLALPRGLGADVDDRLRALVARSLARDPAQRHADARALRDELAGWHAAACRIDPTAPGSAAAAAHGNSTLDFLLRRMRHNSDFPALSDSMARIQGMANSETVSVGSVTNEILKDVALTSKLLRLVNSVHYARGGSIGTVSRAVAVVGFNGIRNMALGLILLEHMQDKAHANLLKEEFLRSLMAGAIASELCQVARDREEAFIGAMFQNLGRLLAEFYFPEEARAVRNLMAAARPHLGEASASTTVLGLSFEALGMGVAESWGLPEGIRRYMRKPTGEPLSGMPSGGDEHQRWIATAANEIADLVLRTDPRELETQLAQAARRFAKVLGNAAGEIQASTATARRKLIDLAGAMELRLAPGSPASRLLRAPKEADGSAQERLAAPDDPLAPLELQATRTGAHAAGEPPPVELPSVAQTLTDGIQDITNAMVEDFKLNDVLRMILETMYRAMGFQRIIFCMRDARSDALVGRFGLGSDVDAVVKSFSVALKASPPDLFAAVCLRGADTMISDATEARITDRLPAWYRKSVNAPTFLLLPLVIKGKPFGLIYADKREKGGLALDQRELSLLRTLRNQAVMAFKQST